MSTIVEGRLAFHFTSEQEATKYDDWAFYRRRFQSCANGSRAVDFLIREIDGDCLWILEVKDFRRDRRTNTEEIWAEIAGKVRDSLAGILAANCNAVDSDQAFAQAAVSCRRLRVVFHLEQPESHSRLFPRIFDPANVQLKLRQLVRAIDAHARVVEMRSMNGIPWRVTEASAP